ncbi:MAG TPA: hypothetical protein VM370_10585 [Candidatus Thermoplasmatota archaeon]|nr:hypothetical protein [Candidatus Thermoplasmatota archaeon]
MFAARERRMVWIAAALCLAALAVFVAVLVNNVTVPPHEGPVASVHITEVHAGDATATTLDNATLARLPASMRDALLAYEGGSASHPIPREEWREARSILSAKARADGTDPSTFAYRAWIIGLSETMM